MEAESEASGHAESTVMDPSLSSHFLQPQTTSHATMLHTFRVALSSSVKPPWKPPQSRAPHMHFRNAPASFNLKSPEMEINQHTEQLYCSIHVYKPRRAAVIRRRAVWGPMSQC